MSSFSLHNPGRPCRPFRFASFALSLVLAACGSTAPSASDSVEATSSALIGGQPGGPPQVGVLNFTSTANSDEYFCSATLVAADLVLAARHCAYDSTGAALGARTDGSWVFSLSPSNDKTTWTDARKIVETIVPPLVTVTATVDWMAPFGAPDLALYRLSTPITSVTPLAVSLDPVTFAKPKFTVAGYGYASHTGDLALGRNTGTTTLLALTGQPAHLIYPTLAAFTQAVSDALQFPVDQFNDVDRAKIQHWYDLTLAEGYEARFGADATDAAPCHGDSGSPILQQGSDSAYVVYGVEQSTLDLNPDNDTRLCDFGPFIALFSNPTAKEFLQQHGLGNGVPVYAGGSGGMGGSAAGGGGSGAASGAAGAAPNGGTAAGGTAAGGTSAGSSGDPPKPVAVNCSVRQASFGHSTNAGWLAAAALGLAGLVRRRRRGQGFLTA